MSIMQYVTAKVRIVTDSTAAKELARKTIQAFARSGWDLNEHNSAVKENEGFIEAEVKVSGFGVKESLSLIEKALEEASSLNNGSYGLLIVESDFGIDGYDCYGNIELAKAPDTDKELLWNSEDFLGLHVTLKASEWAKLLGCNVSSLANEFESQDEGLLSIVLPEKSFEALNDLDGETFEYRDFEPYKLYGESFGDNDDVDVKFDYTSHSLSQRCFEMLTNAINDTCAEPFVPGERLLLRFDNAYDQDGSFVNKMVNLETYCMLVFRTSQRGIEEAISMTPTPVKP